MDDYLSKPVEPAELVRLVERWSGKPGQHSEDAPQERNQSLFQSDSLAALRDYQKEGEPCFRAKLVSVFLESSSLLRETMRVAFEEQRYADLAECAHQLKSSSAVVGAEALSALCQTLEDRGRAGDASQLQKLLLRFDELLSAVSDELQSAVSEELTALSSTERTEND